MNFVMLYFLFVLATGKHHVETASIIEKLTNNKFFADTILCLSRIFEQRYFVLVMMKRFSNLYISVAVYCQPSCLLHSEHFKWKLNIMHELHLH